MKKSEHLPLIKVLSYLSLIEKSVPIIDNFSLYVPSSNFNPNDIISIQCEAKRMMEFIGLKGYTTIVTLCEQTGGTAGNINLNSSNDVFIEIDKSMQINRRNLKEAVLCVMAHEICHKYLYSHGFYLADTNENEYCTDLATFFVGFGLLTINGCYEEYTTNDNNLNGSTTITTHTYRTGYLTPQTYLTAHIAVCKIHNISYLDGVNSNMRIYIADIYRDKIEILSTQLNRESIIEKFKAESKSIANKKREITILKNYLELKEKELLSEYEKKDSLYNRLIVYGNSVEKLPFTAMHVLNIPHECTDSTYCADLLAKVEPKYYGELNDKLLTIKCPFCGTISSSKIEQKGLSIRKCKCGKVFYWDSRIIESQKEVSSNKFTQWIKNLFSRKKITIKNLFYLLLAVSIALCASLWIAIRAYNHTSEYEDIDRLDIEGYEEFIKKYPSSTHVADAYRNIEIVKEEIRLEEQRRIEAQRLEEQRRIEAQRLEEQRRIEAQYGTNSLSNGSQPYSKWYGKNTYYNDYTPHSEIRVKAPSTSDVIVIVRYNNNNQNGKVAGHKYIQAGKSATIYLRNGAHYQTFFYYGKGWYPDKEMKNGLEGGFIKDEVFSKDGTPAYLNNKILTYELRLSKHGNFITSPSNEDEMF